MPKSFVPDELEDGEICSDDDDEDSNDVIVIDNVIDIVDDDDSDEISVVEVVVQTKPKKQRKIEISIDDDNVQMIPAKVSNPSTSSSLPTPVVDITDNASKMTPALSTNASSVTVEESQERAESVDPAAQAVDPVENELVEHDSGSDDEHQMCIDETRSTSTSSRR